MLKKAKNSVLFWFFLITCFFVFFCCNFCFAAKLPLEIKYPELPTGPALPAEPELPSFLLYLYNFGVWFGFLAAILSLVISGVLYLLSNILPGLKVSAKDRFFGAIKGFVLLLLVYLIAVTINPSLSVFEIREKLKEPPKPPAKEDPAGVYFYDKPACFSTPVGYLTSSSNDLGNYKNKINSIKITHNPKEGIYYIALLYDVINLWGKCQYIDPNKGCSSTEPFSASASIYQYSHNPIGNDVTFYRKPFYDKSGGWYTVKNNEIKGRIYVGSLNDLQFKDVPLEEQNCTKLDIKNNCLERKPPTLVDQNISSIKIDGNYIVLLVYFNPKTDKAESLWSFCQAFPTPDDINKEGPKQIKWEAVQNQQHLPNYAIIFPVARK